jgi:hypothetical protein
MRPLVILCLAVAATACRSDNEPEKLTPGQATTPAAPASSSTASTARPSPNPHAAMPAASGGATAPAGSALQYSVPSGWIVQTPSSTMRKAQFLLPKEAGDAEDAQLVLFFFGGEGGSKDDNLKRWENYFAPVDGGAAPQLKTTTRKVNGMAVTEASSTGTLDTSKVQGMGSGTRENWSMLAAIIEAPSGSYYARLLGPAATVGRWEPSFREWISSLKPQS